MKDYIVEKVDEFLKYQGNSIYEQARRDLRNDPQVAEHMVALDKIVDIAVNYASDEDFTFATNSKVEEMSRSVDQLKGQVKLLEGRNIKLSTENTKLNEQVRAAAEVITEARQYSLKNERKERSVKAKNVSGRGLLGEGIIPEYQNKTNKGSIDNETAINEHTNPELYQLQVLSGVRKSN